MAAYVKIGPLLVKAAHYGRLIQMDRRLLDQARPMIATMAVRGRAPLRAADVARFACGLDRVLAADA